MPAWFKDWKFWLAAAVIASVAYYTGVSHAFAADLGGNCCADLEERIAELENKAVRKGDNAKVQLQVTGIVNEAIMAWDDGIFGKAGSTIAPNGVNPTRFVFVGQAQWMPGYFAGFTLAVGAGQWDALTAGNMGVLGPSQNSQLNTYVRESAVWIKSPYGKLSIGKTSQATYRVADVTTAYALHDADEMLSFAPFLGTPGATEIVEFYSGQFLDVVKYESPDVQGFSIAASWGRDGTFNNALISGGGGFVVCGGGGPGSFGCQKNEWDVAAAWHGEYQSFKGEARVGYRDGGVFTGLAPLFPSAIAYADKTYSGGASVMHVPTGGFVDLAYGRTDLGGLILLGPGQSKPIITTWEVRGGFEEHWMKVGHTIFYAEYADMKIDNLLPLPAGDTSTDVTWWGLGVVQAIDAAGMNIYANVKQYAFGDDLKTVAGPNPCTGPGVTACLKDTTVGMVGAAIHF